METTTHSHEAAGVYEGRATCARCSQALVHVFLAKDKVTGEIVRVGPNCHYQLTGVDTRIVEQREAARAARVRHDAAVDRFGRPAEADAIVAAILPLLTNADGKISGPETDTYFLVECQRWVNDPRNKDFTDWVRGYSSLSPEIAAAVTAATGWTFGVSGRRMNSRFAGKCDSCGARIAKGDPIVFDGRAHCADHAI